MDNDGHNGSDIDATQSVNCFNNKAVYQSQGWEFIWFSSHIC